MPDLGLTLEITESAIIGDPQLSFETLPRFRSLGIDVVIDDFGTGYSSLTHLKRYRLSGIKLDESFCGRSRQPGGRDHRPLGPRPGALGALDLIAATATAGP